MKKLLHSGTRRSIHCQYSGRFYFHTALPYDTFGWCLNFPSVYVHLVYFYCTFNYLRIHINSRKYKQTLLSFFYHTLYYNIAHECWLQVSRQTCGWSKFVGQQHLEYLLSICVHVFSCYFLFMVVLIAARHSSEANQQNTANQILLFWLLKLESTDPS